MSGEQSNSVQGLLSFIFLFPDVWNVFAYANYIDCDHRFITKYPSKNLIHFVAFQRNQN